MEFNQSQQTEALRLSFAALLEGAEKLPQAEKDLLTQALFKLDIGSEEPKIADFQQQYSQLQQQYSQLQQQIKQQQYSQQQQRVTLQRQYTQLQRRHTELQRQHTQLQRAKLVAARAAIERERERYQQLFEFAPDGYLVIDTAGTIQEANRAAATLLNIPQQSLVGLALIDFVASEQRIVFHNQLIGLRVQEWVKEWEVRLIPHNSQPIEAALTIAVVRNCQSIPVALRVCMRDITVAKHSREQICQLNAQLSQRVQFEAMLRRITDKVRDSLDENQILQTAVKELALVLGISCCNTALYDLEEGISTISYEYATSNPGAQARVMQLSAFPEVYQQLLSGQESQFCSLTPNPLRGRVAMLATPIFDGQEVIGDLWLTNQSDYAFNELEIRLVQQIATQCAIAIRQARLYGAATAQVEELERLNRLKDDFLNTVSHELRTPMASIKMATSMLEIVLKQAGILDAPNRAAQYLQILRHECQRETGLINDLLDLSRLDAGTEALNLTALDLSTWISPIVESFVERVQTQQQSLETHIPTDLPALITDASKLERILTELLNNACKYTPAGERILITAKAELNFLRLIVSNSGVEIPAAELVRLFDKFYRIPNNDPWKHGGTGLGLALVKKLVEHLGGTIQATASQRWTSFAIEIPMRSRLGQPPGF